MQLRKDVLMLHAAWRACRSSACRQRGGVLLESIVAVGLLASVMSLAVQGLGMGSRAVGTVRDLTTAQVLARSQLEYTMADTYCAPPCAYAPISAPSPYSVTAQGETYPNSDPNLQSLVVTVYKDGQILEELRAIKVNR